MPILQEKRESLGLKYLSEYSSPLGRLLLLSDEAALTALWFEGQRHAPVLTGKEETVNPPQVILETKEWLDGYFGGQRPTAYPNIRLEGTMFQKRVWEQLVRIPYGTAITYGDIAKRMAGNIGMAHLTARAVGGAVGHNPISIIVPCHRVIGSTGRLTGYAGGLERKEWLLRFEGALPKL